MLKVLGGRKRRSRTFISKKPKKRAKVPEHFRRLKKHKEEFSGDLKKAVSVPDGEDRDEWMAVNVVDFFNMTNLINGSVTNVCTAESCPKMTAGEGVEYRWANPPKVKVATSLPAVEYINNLMSLIETKVNNPKIFPTESSHTFPRNFVQEVKDIFRRLFRVYAHVYHSHFQIIEESGEVENLNTAFKHFMFFVFEFDLMEWKELLPLKNTILHLLGEEYAVKFKK